MDDLHEQRFTSEIYALRLLNRGPDKSFVGWAENMVLAGYASDALFILLGEREPFNKFEFDDLLDRIQRELGLPRIVSEEEALKTVATANLRRFKFGEATSADTLGFLSKLCTDHGYSSILHDFFLLHHAAADLELEYVQFYWPDANRDNIEKIISDYSVQWLEKHTLSAWQSYEWRNTMPTN